MVIGWAIEEVWMPDAEVTAFVVGGEKVINDSVNWFQSLDFDAFLSVPAAPVSPLHYYLSLGRDLHSALGVVLLKQGEPGDLMVTAAKKGCWNIKLADLQLPADEYDIQADGPSTIDFLVPLIKKWVPDITAEDLTRILDAISLKPSDPVAEIVAGENLDGVLEHDQVEQAEDHVESNAKSAKESLAFRASVKSKIGKD